jgi:hypothetical protein
MQQKKTQTTSRPQTAIAMQCLRRVSARRLLLCTSAHSLHLRTFAALSTFARRRPLSKLFTHTYSPLLFGQQSLGLLTRRGLCTARDALTDVQELQRYLQLTDVEVARIVKKSQSNLVGNGVNHNFVEGTLKPLQEYLGLTIAELKKIVLGSVAVLSCRGPLAFRPRCRAVVVVGCLVAAAVGSLDSFYASTRVLFLPAPFPFRLSRNPPAANPHCLCQLPAGGGCVGKSSAL